MLGVKDISSINSTLVFSLMHLFLKETDLDSVVRDQYIKENLILLYLINLLLLFCCCLFRLAITHLWPSLIITNKL